MKNNLNNFIQRVYIFITSRILYSVIYSRISYLKFKRSLKSSFEKIPTSYSALKSSLQYNNWEKSIFKWKLSDNSARLRIQILTLGFSLVFLTIAIRLLIVASNEYEKYHQASNSSNSHRLDITDRNNNLLAVNLPGASLYANPEKVLDPELAVRNLHSIIPELNMQETLRKLKSDKSFVWIKRDLTPQEHEKIYNLGMPGFNFERQQKRIYTYGNLLSHIIGYVGRDLNGLAGIEKYFDNFLSGKKEKENRNSWGNVLNLSIDIRIQNILSEEIEKTMKKFSAKGATGIVVDPNNGEILALVSKPDFDPHNPGKASENQLFNMATQGVYEVGSSMKALTMAIGLDANATSLTDAYDLSYMKVNGFQLKDPSPLKGWVSVPHLFLKSSNIGVSQITLEVGATNFANYLRKLGLLEQAKIELPERSTPLFPPSSRWNDLSLTTMSYGYGISVSPLHFMQAMVPTINGGTMYPLTLIKRDTTKPIVGERVLQEETSIAMRKLMRLVVSKGTGRQAEVEGYYIGGKTGTANIAHAGKYDKTRRVSSFIGVMPASKPKYMLYVIYYEPKGIKETFNFAGGAWVAAPTAAAVFKRMAALYGIEKLDESSPEIQELINIEYKIQNET